MGDSLMIRVAQRTTGLGLAALSVAALCIPACGTPPVIPPGAIRHVLVIELENESYSSTFGPDSPATYLNDTLLPQGELVPNWYATSHVSLGNYLAQVSGQGPTASTNSDCINAATLSASLIGQYFDVAPGTDASSAFPGQVMGDGCVYPGPNSLLGTHGAMTIGDQLDAKYGAAQYGANGQLTFATTDRILWREYAEDMGNTPARDFGDLDPLGGTDCAHPPLSSPDTSNSATAADQYATRHNPFVYFHTVIDDQARCDTHVVPLGSVSVGTGPSGVDEFSGHLYQDLQHEGTTPLFMFVTPNLCDDGHDSSCKGLNTEGTQVGGLAGADTWLKHWMPMILNSEAYRNGSLLVVLTFDEGAVGSGSALDASACPPADQGNCNAPSGPNLSYFGFSPLLAAFGIETAGNVYPGGGQIGAVLFNSRFIVPGSINTTGYYNHFSALRSYEDLLGINGGGDDGMGHLGWAALAQYQTFGPDVFNNLPD
jgi:hypothetical protein